MMINILAKQTVSKTRILTTRAFSNTTVKLLNNESFMGAFINSIKKQVKENKEFEENVKTLGSKGQSLVDIKYLNKAKVLLDKAKSELNNNKATKLVGEAYKELDKHAKLVGKSVEEVMKEINESRFITMTKEQAQKINSIMLKTTEPIRNSKVYKNVKKEVNEVIEEDILETYDHGYKSKEDREKYKERIVIKNKEIAKTLVRENENAGINIVLHKDHEEIEKKKTQKENNILRRAANKVKEKYKNSDNAFISYGREIQEGLGRLFAESEHAKAIAELKRLTNSNFDPDEMLKITKRIIIPELLEAINEMNRLKLMELCSEAVTSMLLGEYGDLAKKRKADLVIKSKVIDLRRAQIASIKILENEVPVVIISFQSMEIKAIYNKTDKKLLYGSEDKIVKYDNVMVMALDPENLLNENTFGWKIIELARR